MEICIIEKVNNEIATKLRVNVMNNRRIFWYILSALRNLMTKFCSALFKCENKLKIGWEN